MAYFTGILVDNFSMETDTVETIKYSFSGHDSFQCRQLWLKKGYDYINSEKAFNDEDAVVKLGVGKNMVSSIRYWMRAFNVIDNKDSITEFGMKLFSDTEGWDPFLEDDASIWLLHYQLVRTKVASIYSIIFNDFRKEKNYFDKDKFLNYLKRRSETEDSLNINENTVGEDFGVFLKMYQGGDIETKEVEDSFSGILSELELLKTNGIGKETYYQIENDEKDNLPEAILLFSILDNPKYGNSIGLGLLEHDIDSPGSIFCIDKPGLLHKVKNLVEKHQGLIHFTDHAGIKELQIKDKVDKYKILDDYYGR